MFNPALAALRMSPSLIDLRTASSSDSEWVFKR